MRDNHYWPKNDFPLNAVVLVVYWWLWIIIVGLS
jgi:hypothetical protein